MVAIISPLSPKPHGCQHTDNTDPTSPLSFEEYSHLCYHLVGLAGGTTLAGLLGRVEPERARLASRNPSESKHSDL